MGILQSILVAIAMGLLLTENLGYGHIQISRPVFAGPIIGLILGDIQTGLIVGGTVELMFMGVFPVGGSVPPNAQFAGMMSTVFAIASGGNPEVGITLAYPVGVFAQFVILLDYNINLLIIHKADRDIEKGVKNAVEKNLFLSIFLMFTAWTVSAFLGCYFGSEFVGTLYSKLPEFIRLGLSVAGGIMPAMGMAMLLKMMDFKKYWCILLVGYVLSSFLKMNILSIALLGVGVAVSIYVLNKKDETSDSYLIDDNKEVGEKSRIVTKDDLKRVNLRSYLVGGNLNYERYLGLGFNYAIMPVLKRVYTDEEDLKEAVTRHMEFYNTHPWMHNIILGIVAAMEEERALGGNVTVESISATKAALMGPTAGFGDSFFKGVIVTIAGGIAASLAIEGNMIAPIVFIVPCIVVMVLVRNLGTSLGYEYGSKILLQLRKGGALEKFIRGSSVVGMLVTAGLITNYVKFNLKTVFVINGSELVLNNLINGILPQALPYLITFFYYWIINKNPKNGMYITLLLSFIIGIIGNLIGIL